jgi:hypothetical protein
MCLHVLHALVETCSTCKCTVFIPELCQMKNSQYSLTNSMMLQHSISIYSDYDLYPLPGEREKYINSGRKRKCFIATETILF